MLRVRIMKKDHSGRCIIAKTLSAFIIVPYYKKRSAESFLVPMKWTTSRLSLEAYTCDIHGIHHHRRSTKPKNLAHERSRFEERRHSLGMDCLVHKYRRGGSSSAGMNCGTLQLVSGCILHFPKVLDVVHNQRSHNCSTKPKEETE